jgi:hypothetical protein
MTIRRAVCALLLSSLACAACGNDDADRPDAAGPDRDRDAAQETTPPAASAPDDARGVIIETVSGARGEVLAAAVTSTDDGSARMVLSLEMGSLLSITGKGELDFDTQDMAFTLDMGSLSALAPGAVGDDDMTIEIRNVDGIVYMRVPEFMGSALGGGDAEWVAFDTAEALDSTGLSDETLAQLQQQADPSAYLAFLRRASDDIEEVGSDTIRGDATTHYAGTLDLAATLDELPDEVQDLVDDALPSEGAGSLGSIFEQLGLDVVPFEVWIDDEGRMRKMAIVMDLTELFDQLGGDDMPAGFGGEMQMELELHDYGVEVDVEAPPAADVERLDLSELGDLGS